MLGLPVSDPLYAFDDFVGMTGFPKVWDFEKKYADLLAQDQQVSFQSPRSEISPRTLAHPGELR